jgi:hypothetical protein
MVPNVAELIDVVEMLHRSLLYRILRSIDRIHSNSDKHSTLSTIGFLLGEVLSLKLCESVDHAAVEHLVASLDHRSLVLCSVLAATHLVTQGTSTVVSRHEIKLSGFFAETSENWPPCHCKNGRINHLKNGEEKGCSDCPQPPALDVQPVPLDYSQVTPTCYPSMMMCCLPWHVLAFLDVDIEALTEDIQKPDGSLQRGGQFFVRIWQKGCELELCAILGRTTISISVKAYLDALAFELRSDNGRAKFVRPVQ